MTPVEQHLEEYEEQLLVLVQFMIKGSGPGYIKAARKELAVAREKLADHIAIVTQHHSHSQYELKTYGLP